MRRSVPRPYGATLGPSRILSLLLALGVLALLYDRFRDPTMWGWTMPEEGAQAPVQPTVGSLARAAQARARKAAEPRVEILAEKPAAENPAADKVGPEKAGAVAVRPKDAAPLKERDPAEPIEPLIYAPNDLDPEELADAKIALEVVGDKTPLQGREMSAYWRFCSWSLSQSFQDMAARAHQDMAFTQFWEQPEKYRGELVELRLHVRRVLKYDAPENSSGAKTVVEVWGWTDESKSFPYCCVLVDPPADLPVGTEVSAEMRFVGYFLKIMSYRAFDVGRGAPMLIGRARLIVPRKPAGTSASEMGMLLIAGLGLAVVVIGSIFLRRRSKTQELKSALPEQLPVNLSEGFSSFEADEVAVNHGIPFLGAPSHGAPLPGDSLAPVGGKPEDAAGTSPPA